MKHAGDNISSGERNALLKQNTARFRLNEETLWAIRRKVNNIKARGFFLKQEQV